MRIQAFKGCLELFLWQDDRECAAFALSLSLSLPRYFSPSLAISLPPSTYVLSLSISPLFLSITPVLPSSHTLLNLHSGQMSVYVCVCVCVCVCMCIFISG